MKIHYVNNTIRIRHSEDANYCVVEKVNYDGKQQIVKLATFDNSDLNYHINFKRAYAFAVDYINSNSK